MDVDARDMEDMMGGLEPHPKSKPENRRWYVHDGASIESVLREAGLTKTDEQVYPGVFTWKIAEPE